MSQNAQPDHPSNGPGPSSPDAAGSSESHPDVASNTAGSTTAPGAGPLTRFVRVIVIAGLVSAVLWTAGWGRHPDEINPVGPPVDWREDLETSAELARQTGKPMWLHFSAEWCGACQQMADGVLMDPEVTGAIEDAFVPVKVDLTSGTGPNAHVGTRYDVQYLPTSILTDADGNVIDRRVGTQSKSQILAWIAEHRG